MAAKSSAHSHATKLSALLIGVGEAADHRTGAAHAYPGEAVSDRIEGVRMTHHAVSAAFHVSGRAAGFSNEDRRAAEGESA
jgi:hypothetical protein